MQSIANVLLQHFYLEELLSQDTLERLERQKGIRPDSIGSVKFEDLPSYAQKEIQSLVEPIEKGLKDKGYYWFTTQCVDSLLFIKTKNGFDYLLVVGDLQRDRDNLRVIADKTLEKLEQMYKEAITPEAKKTIEEEARNWIRLTPFAKSCATTIYDKIESSNNNL